MVTVFPLASGSSGNSFYISAGEGQGGILIDAGISARRIRGALDDAGIGTEGIRAILVTHDHSDHTSGLRVLAKQLRVPLYGSETTLQHLSACMEPQTRLIPLEAEAEIAGMGIVSFPTQHDAEGSVGFRIETGRRVIGFATDLGCITDVVWDHLRGSQLVVLESNYDENMLRICRYDRFLKQRICSDYGHLANSAAAECITRLTQRGTSRFILAHLSRESNTPDLALETARERLSREGLHDDCDYRLTVAKRDIPTEPIRF